MKLSLGIVGLPNVGKSTLFNALTKQEVLAANYPFATIDPNHGIVPVADERLYKIANVEKPAKITPAVVEFVDIAGLVKGAAEGEGLGNQFLANIREVSAIVHLVRTFKDNNITHVEDSVDAKRDIELINTELILKDLETVEKKAKEFEGKSKSNPKLKPVWEFFINLQNHLSSGKLANEIPHSSNEDIEIERRNIFLLTDKPVIYLANANEAGFAESIALLSEVTPEGSKLIAMDVKIESELAQMDDADRLEFMNELGMEKSGLEKLTLLAYETLGLISYFTSGPTEVRAWTIKKGDTAPEAAGAIHTDIQQGFIAADVVNWQDFIDNGGWQGAKEAGKQRLEGKSYIVQDGDVILFKHNK